MAFANKRQHVMFAQGVELDVLYEDQLAGVLGEERTIDDILDLDPIAGRQLGPRVRDPLGRPTETLASGVLPELSDVAFRKIVISFALYRRVNNKISIIDRSYYLQNFQIRIFGNFCLASATKCTPSKIYLLQKSCNG